MDESVNVPMDIDNPHQSSFTELTDSAELDLKAQERKAKALEKRAKLMSQISNLQKKFLDEHKEELEQIDSGNTVPGLVLTFR